MRLLNKKVLFAVRSITIFIVVILFILHPEHYFNYHRSPDRIQSILAYVCTL